MKGDNQSQEAQKEVLVLPSNCSICHIGGSEPGGQASREMSLIVPRARIRRKFFHSGSGWITLAGLAGQEAVNAMRPATVCTVLRLTDEFI